jgi:hypothetical protein
VNVFVLKNPFSFLQEGIIGFVGKKFGGHNRTLECPKKKKKK